MPLRWSISVAASFEPVTVAQARLHCRAVSGSEEDDWFDIAIQAAREMVEAWTNTQLCRVTLVQKLAAFPAGSRLRIARPPLSSVDHIKYYDTSNELQTLSSSYYSVSIDSMPGYVELGNSYAWPTTYIRDDAVIVTTQSGYGSEGQVPAPLRQAILMLVAHWYENREAVLTGSISKELEFAVASMVGAYTVQEFV